MYFWCYPPSPEEAVYVWCLFSVWQRKRREDNIREWIGLEFGKSQRAVENRGKWRKLVAKSAVVPQLPSRWRVKGLMMMIFSVWNLRAITWFTNILSSILFFWPILLRFLFYLFFFLLMVLSPDVFPVKFLSIFRWEIGFCLYGCVQQVEEVSWSVVSAAGCHVALVYTFTHFHDLKKFRPFLFHT